MTLRPDLHDTLAAIGTALEAAQEPWWIMAGAAAEVLGARDVPAADVDVLIGLADARRLLPALGVEEAAPTAHPRYRSAYFGHWRRWPLVVEFMAGFDFRDPDGEWRPMRPKTRRAVPIGATRVFVPDWADLAAMLERFDRPKDHARIALLNRLYRAP